jgi:hypothetical protein
MPLVAPRWAPKARRLIEEFGRALLALDTRLGWNFVTGTFVPIMKRMAGLTDTPGGDHATGAAAAHRAGRAEGPELRMPA